MIGELANCRIGAFLLAGGQVRMYGSNGRIEWTDDIGPFLTLIFALTQANQNDQQKSPNT
jgi:hypothetical protein